MFLFLAILCLACAGGLVGVTLAVTAGEISGIESLLIGTSFLLNGVIFFVRMVDEVRS